MPSVLLPIQAASISASLLAAGAIASFNLFGIPLAQSQPASQALLSISWIFNQGSYYFPTTTILSTAGFTYLAINALPSGRAATQLLNVGSNGPTTNGYFAAAALNLAIAPFTEMLMIPLDFKIVELNKTKGGAKRERSAQEEQHGVAQRSTEDSVSGKDDINQSTDLGGPQPKIEREPTAEEDKEVQELLRRFAWLNGFRATLAAAGGIIGLIASLS